MRTLSAPNLNRAGSLTAANVVPPGSDWPHAPWPDQAKSGRFATFGLAADPKDTKFWRKKSIYDESEASRVSNRRGVVSFVGSPGKHKRTTKMVINFSDNADLDSQGYTPFAYISWGMVHADGIFKGARVEEARVIEQGEKYLAEVSPRCTGITSARQIDSIREVLR